MPAYSELAGQIETLNNQILEWQRYLNDFEEWKAEGESIDVEFQVLN